MDGGCTDSIPVRAFMELGYRRNVVILTRHKGYKKKPEKAGLEKLFYRRYPEFAKALRNRPWVYNRQLEEIEALKEEGKIFLIRPSEPLSISRTSKDPAEIEAVYQIGMEDGKRQLPAWAMSFSKRSIVREELRYAPSASLPLEARMRKPSSSRFLPPTRNTTTLLPRLTK